MLQKVQGAAKSRSWTRRIPRSKHHHVYVRRHRLDQGRKFRELYFSDSIKIKKTAERFSQGPWTFLGPRYQKKWYGTISFKPDGQWNSVVSSMVQGFEETGHPIFKGISALRRGNLKRKQYKDTMLFNVDSSNTELLFRIIHSASQLSILKQTLKEVRPQEVNSPVHTPKDDQQASGNRLRDTLQRLEKQDTETLFAWVCGVAVFVRRVYFGMSYKNYSWGGRTPACSEYTHPREHTNSIIYSAIPGNTTIGPVLQVHMVNFLDNYGIEIEILSTATPDRIPWVIICRGKNRYVENVSLQDPWRILTSSDLLLERFIAKSNEPRYVKMESFLKKHQETDCDANWEISWKHRKPLRIRLWNKRNQWTMKSLFILVTGSERYSRLWKLQPEHSFCRDLEVCGQVGTPLWPARKRNGRRRSLEFYEFQTEGCISNIRRTTMLR